MWCGLPMPSPDPIGEPAGITAAQPTSASRRARIGSSLVYGNTRNPSPTSCLGGPQQLDAVRQQGPLVADHLELDQVRLERVPGQVRGLDRVRGGVAPGGVRQHAARPAGPASAAGRARPRRPGAARR